MSRILIDGTMTQGGGGLTYLVNMVPCLAARAPDHHFLLVVRNERVAQALPPAQNLAIELLPPASFERRLRFVFFEGSRLASRFGADLYFSVGETVPFFVFRPRIASLRNANAMLPLTREYSGREVVRMLGLRATAAIAARLCDRILFVSEDSARWMGDALGLPPGKRVVVHHGVDALAWRKAAAKGRRLARPYVLSVSSIYRYKNFVRLIEAYAQLAETSSGRSVPDLVIIGDDQDPPYRRQMEAARAATGALADRIHFMGAVPYADVAAWYAGAELFVFPSYLETFGHPLLEALAAGVPLVAADTPVAREIAGDAALFADPQRSDALADAMRVGLWDPAVRADLVARGEERVREFTWLRAAESLLALFAEVLAERALGTPRKRERGAAASSGRIAGQREPAPAPASERGVGGA